MKCEYEIPPQRGGGRQFCQVPAELAHVVRGTGGKAFCQFHLPNDNKHFYASDYEQQLLNDFDKYVSYMLENGGSLPLQGFRLPIPIQVHSEKAIETVLFDAVSDLYSIQISPAQISKRLEFCGAAIRTLEFSNTKIMQPLIVTGLRQIKSFSIASSECSSVAINADIQHVSLDDTLVTESLNIAKSGTKSIYLSKVTAEKKVELSGKFTGVFLIDNQCQFKADFSIHNSRINSGESGHVALFRDLSVLGRTTFHNTTFLNGFQLVNSVFQHFDMQSAAVERAIDIENCTFHKSLDWRPPTRVSPEPNPARFPAASVINSRFEGVLDYSNRSFSGPLRFSGCEFHKAPITYAASHFSGTKYINNRFLDFSSPESPSAYNELARSMKTIGNRVGYGEFYALEQLALLKQQQGTFFELLLSSLYKTTSFYGTSIARPIVCLVLLIIGFFLIYMTLTPCPLIHTPKQEVFKFTMQQITQPFRIWGTGIDDTLLHLFPGYEFTVRFLATAQSLLGAGIITTLILAIRWHFRREQ